MCVGGCVEGLCKKDLHTDNSVVIGGGGKGGGDGGGQREGKWWWKMKNQSFCSPFLHHHFWGARDVWALLQEAGW